MMVNAKMKERTDEKGMEGVCDDVDKAEIQINKQVYLKTRSESMSLKQRERNTKRGKGKCRKREKIF